MNYSLEDKPKPRKLQKNKSFISRLSTVLVRNQLKLNNNQPYDSPSSILKNKSPKHEPTKQKQVLKDAEHKDSNDSPTEYATICDIIQADRSDDESPPVPPKNLNELYAKVNKRKIHVSVGCNTDSAASPVQPCNQTENAINKHLTNDKIVTEKVTSFPKALDKLDAKEFRKRHAINKSRNEKKKKSNILKTVILHHQEELKSLKEELAKVTNRNEDLQNHLKSLLDQEKKWREEMSTTLLFQRDHLNIMEKNSELNEKITRLELETRQEVQILCDKVANVRVERDRLSEEVQSLKQENKILLTKYDGLKEERRGLISVQTHINEMKDYHNSQKEMLSKHEKELKMLREKCEKYEDEKNSSLIETQLQIEEKKHLESEVLNFKNQNQDLMEKNEQQSKRLGELSRKERENYELIVSMTRTIKDLTSERDLLLKKSEFQDTQQKTLQSAYVQQSRGFVHLEEYIAKSNRQMNNSLHTASVKAKEAETNYSKMKISYEEQLEVLRSKILEQTCIINSLNDNKKKSEQDLNNMWSAVLQSRGISEADFIKKDLTDLANEVPLAESTSYTKVIKEL